MVELIDKFCRCVKKIKRTLGKESTAIAICTRSVISRKGKRQKTLKKFSCGLKGTPRFLMTQKVARKDIMKRRRQWEQKKQQRKERKQKKQKTQKQKKKQKKR